MVNFIFLVKFDIAAHDNNRLPHKKHEHPTQNGEYQNGNGTKRNNLSEGPVEAIDPGNEIIHQHIGLARRNIVFPAGKQGLYFIHHKGCNLRGKHRQVVGHENKYNTCRQAITVLPEVFIDCL